MLTVPQSQVLSDSQSTSEAQLRYNLELKRLKFEERKAAMEAEAEERKAKMEIEKAKLEFDLRALEINARSRPPPDSQSSFQVETAAKLLPKLGSEQEVEVYLITFRKIAN